MIDRLFEVVKDRRNADPATSYVASLYRDGRAKIARKVGEEAVEAIVAALEDDRGQTVAESADLLFHLMVLWAEMGIKPDEVMAELARREGVSGIEEKRGRV
ncbi:MAG: phosphoribosyl-ATP diphosphatase [Sphingomonadales bacterium]